MEVRVFKETWNDVIKAAYQGCLQSAVLLLFWYMAWSEGLRRFPCSTEKDIGEQRILSCMVCAVWFSCLLTWI